ncbi:uncharacterized protein METZ01_LOCUS138526, partial [marine metagenome]
ITFPTPRKTSNVLKKPGSDSATILVNN